jgi:hypothetical protein
VIRGSGRTTAEARRTGGPEPARALSGPESREDDGSGVRPLDTGQTAASAAPESEEPQPQVVEFEAVEGLPRALRLVGSVVAPTTLVTALLFYFGLLYAVGYYRFFGVNFTVLDLPFQGILILSASTGILPLAVLATVTLLAVWIYQLPLDRLAGVRRTVVARVVLPMSAVVGTLLLGLVVADILLRGPVFPRGLGEARGLSLVGGLLLLIYAARLRSALRPRRGRNRVARAPQALTAVKWGSLFVLFSVGMFWAVGSYAVRVGTADASNLAAGLRCVPDVVVYSEKDLNLSSATVRQEVSGEPGSGYVFRYPGLKIVPQAGPNYLLVPADWSRATGPAILLPRSDTVRLEFVPATVLC